jgi:hypothetical protein
MLQARNRGAECLQQFLARALLAVDARDLLDQPIHQDPACLITAVGLAQACCVR